MKLCGCCKKTQCSSPSLPLARHQKQAFKRSFSSNYVEEDNHGCHSSENQYITCSEERRRAICKWERKHFQSSQTTCGTIAFKGDTRQSLAECVHLHSSEIEDGGVFKEDKLDAIYELLTETWNIHAPNHIVSVIGGTRNFDLDEEILNHFKGALRNVSQTSGAWVITCGTHTGVMKHVSDALKDEKDLICIGIPVFGRIANNTQLYRPCQDEGTLRNMLPYNTGSWMKAKEDYLDSCHSHLVMYDDTLAEKDRGDIHFRAALEHYITNKSKKPYVQVVLNGGKGTLRAIFETIRNGHKVILVKGSGGAADLLVEEIKNGNSNEFKKEHEKLHSKLTDLKNYHGDLEMCKDETNKKLFSIAEKHGKNSISNCITQCLMPTNAGCKKEALRLALLWQDVSSLTKIIPVSKRTDEGSAAALEYLMVLALARGNATFVKILLQEYEVAINDVLNLEVLKLLYGYRSYEKNVLKIFKVKLKGGENYEEAKTKETKDLAKYIYLYSKNHSGEKGQLLKESAIDEMRKKFCKRCPDIAKTMEKLPLWELFIWSVVSNLPDIAKVVWPLGEDQIGKALIASHFFGNLAREYELLEINDHETSSYRENSDTFKKLACHLLDECHTKNERNATQLVRQNMSLADQDEDIKISKSNLELAVQYRIHDFVAHTSVQKVLTDVWAGKLAYQQVSNVFGYICMFFAIFIPVLIPFLRFNEDEVEKHHQCSSSSSLHKIVRKRISSWAWKIKHFYSAPVVGFLLNLVFHIAFVVLYSTLLVVRGKKMDVHVTPACIVLYVTVGGFLTTELYQISQYDEKRVWKKIKSWFSDYYTHNIWDVFNILLFLVAVFMNIGMKITGKCAPKNSSAANATTNMMDDILYESPIIDDEYIRVNLHVNHTEHNMMNHGICFIPHTLHAINCACWILRITTALRVYPKFGQYYEMVKLMLADLLGFIIGVVFIVLAYGVFSTSILYPDGEAESLERRFLSLFVKPWFHIYGEYFIEQAGADSTESAFVEGKKSKTYEDYLVWIALGIYLCITNIVLLNILIAVFNNTYSKVIAKGTKIWRFNRYQVIVEYMNRCTSPPPFCILQHTFLLLRWIYKGCRMDGNSTTKKMNSKTSVDVQKLCKAEKILLSQFQCDRALHIFKHDMDIINGKVVLKDSEDKRHLEKQEASSSVAGKDDATDNAVILSTLREIMVKVDDQSRKMEDLSKENIDQRRKIEVQSMKNEVQNKTIDEQSKTIDEQNKTIDEQSKEITKLRNEKLHLQTKMIDIIEQAEEQGKVIES